MDDAPPGVPEWVVTYGDMMSLLLTFFIMLVSLSEIRADQKYRAVLEAIQHHMGYRATKIAPPGEHFPLNSLIQELETLGSFNDSDERGGVKTPDLVSGEDFKSFNHRQGKQILVGDYIPFTAGSAILTDETVKPLELLFAEVAGKPHKFEIRGYATSKVETNQTDIQQRQLGYQRARAVYDHFLKLGVERDRMRVVAMGDETEAHQHQGHYIRPDDRVEVILLDVYSTEYVGPKK